MRRFVLLMAIAMAWFGARAAAQDMSAADAAASDPPAADDSLGETTLPATAPTTRRALVVPQGFERISESGRDAICMPADEPWVRQALQEAAPATRPSTLPIDLLERAKANRAEIARQIQQDLGFDDASVIDAMFDDKLLPMLRQFDELNPPIIYMPTTRDKLRELLRNGWEDPRFYYNRAADDVQFRMAVNLTIDRAVDDTLLPAIYAPSDPIEQRKRVLIDSVQQSEAEIADAKSGRSQFLTQMAFVQLVNDQAMKPLNLSPEQAWFGLGVSGFLAAKYAAPILGVPRAQLLEAMTFEHPRNPVKAATIDLMHPTPATELRERYVALYLDAMRRKSIGVVAGWVGQAGEDAIARTLAAMRQAPPADAGALVELIRQTTGADLSPQLSPQ